MANLPVLQSLPEEAVDVVYDGMLGDAWYWIVHIEPSGTVWVYRYSNSRPNYQCISSERLELAWSAMGYSTVGAFINAIIRNVGIEGLTRASDPGPVGRIQSLSDIAYRIVPVSE